VVEKDLCKILTLYAQGNLDQGLGGASGGSTMGRSGV